jgi:hypothetical protein
VANQARPRGDFTVMHREHHIWRFHRRAQAGRKHLSTLSMLSKFQRRGVASECSEAAVPERGDHPDLLGEEADGESIWWSW